SCLRILKSNEMVLSVCCNRSLHNEQSADGADASNGLGIRLSKPGTSCGMIKPFQRLLCLAVLRLAVRRADLCLGKLLLFNLANCSTETTTTTGRPCFSTSTGLALAMSMSFPKLYLASVALTVCMVI